MSEVVVQPWRADWREHFARLNLDWLQRYFSVEDIDRRVLSDPEIHILAPGGQIFFAAAGSEVIGTCSLLRESEGVYELSKMAVDPAWQGRGIGRQLLLAAIAHFQAQGGSTLFLESNRRLLPAIQLYSRMGFVDLGRRPNSHYARSDIYMVWQAPGPH